MAGAREIRDRIESIRETQKITSAMYLIASTKLRRAKADLANTRPYFDTLRGEIKRVFRTVANADSPYFYPVDDATPREGTYGCLVITADKGLAGAYNQNVIRETEKLLRQHPDTRLYVVGEYGRRYFEQKGIRISQSFPYTAQNPTLDRARAISARLLDRYERGILSEIFVVYTDMKSGLVTQAHSTRLLPLHRSQFRTAEKERAVREPFEFYPSVTEVLNGVIPSYIAGFIYSALVDSFCCEQNARMTAMDAANQNAEELLSSLSTQFNRVRQSAITQEITEISAGAQAQRRKHESLVGQGEKG